MTRQLLTTTLAIALSAGSAGTTLAQSGGDDRNNNNRDDNNSQNTDRQQQNPDRQADQARADAQTESLRFVGLSPLKGAAVNNNSDEQLGRVHDLIMDRGSGRAHFVVIEHGGILGFGETELAIPYDRFSYDHQNKDFELRITRDDMNQAEWDAPRGWVRLTEDNWTDQMSRRRADLNQDRRDRNLDPFKNQASDSTAQRISGKVVRIDRVPIDGEEFFVASISRTGEGRSRDNRKRNRDDAQERRGDRRSADARVILGPSWFVVSDGRLPMNGDKMTVRASRVDLGDGHTNLRAHRNERSRDARERSDQQPNDRANDQISEDRNNNDRWFVAHECELGGRNMKLRDESGNAMWAGRHARNVPRFVLANDLVGREASTRNGDGGTVEDIVFETTSGSAAFLSFDPNDNFLGIADELKAVPWSVVTVAPDGKLRIHATKSSVQNAEAIPANFTHYQTKRNLDAVYTPFGVDRERFENDDPYSSVQGWGPDSVLAKEMRHDTRDALRQVFEGELTATGELNPIEGMDRGTTVTVETDNGRQTIVIGPTEVLERNGPELNTGAEISIAAQRVMIDGRAVWIARSLTINGETYTMWDQNDRPLYTSIR